MNIDDYFQQLFRKWRSIESIIQKKGECGKTVLDSAKNMYEDCFNEENKGGNYAEFQKFDRRGGKERRKKSSTSNRSDQGSD